MSRAFVREQDGDTTADELPERPISPHRNFVTPEGLAAIEAEVERLQAELNGVGEDRATRARLARNLRYWRAKRATAELAPPPADNAEVRFGSTVTISRADGRTQTFHIVGEDEADPARGTLSYVAPLARALIGKAAGETVDAPGGDVEIISIRQ
jgi:transcription elongation GreA/GreB family factor